MINIIVITSIICLFCSIMYGILFHDRRYSEREMVSFGNYLLSDRRYDRVFDVHGDDDAFLSVVHDADLSNWHEEGE